MIAYIKKIFFCSYIILCFTLGSVLISCSTVATAAGSLSSISSTADAISKSASAIDKASEDFTPEQEYYIGRAVGANILEKYKPYTSGRALTIYANKICQAITVNSPAPELYNGYHVMILDSDEINAFATSGGHIFITRGLLACANSEDSLAAVIAHEVAHIQLKHSIKAIKASRTTQAVVVTGTSAASVAGQGTALGELTNLFSEDVNKVVTAMVNNGYSQSQEFDADDLAMSLMAASGYEPSSLIDMLKLLQQNQPKHPGGFGKTHPSPDKRIKNAQEKIKTYKVADTREYREPRFKSVK